MIAIRLDSLPHHNPPVWGLTSEQHAVQRPSQLLLLHGYPFLPGCSWLQPPGSAAQVGQLFLTAGMLRASPHCCEQWSCVWFAQCASHSRKGTFVYNCLPLAFLQKCYFFFLSFFLFFLFQLKRSFPSLASFSFSCIFLLWPKHMFRSEAELTHLPKTLGCRPLPLLFCSALCRKAFPLPVGSLLPWGSGCMNPWAVPLVVDGKWADGSQPAELLPSCSQS